MYYEKRGLYARIGSPTAVLRTYLGHFWTLIHLRRCFCLIQSSPSSIIQDDVSSSKALPVGCSDSDGSLGDIP